MGSLIVGFLFSSDAALVFNDLDTAQEILAALSGQPNVPAASIFSANGRLLAGYTKQGADTLEQAAALLPPMETVYEKTLKALRELLTEVEDGTHIKGKAV